MKNFRYTLLALLIGLPLALGTGCTKKEDDGNLQVFHNSLGDDIKTFDPANAYDTISLEVAPSIYETLYQYSYLSSAYKTEPLLAADMPKYSADRLTVTIPVRKGIKFADDPCFKETKGKGREVTAEDFIYAWKRLALPRLESQGWWIFENKVAGIDAFAEKLKKAPKEELAKVFAEPIEGIQALDRYTIQIKLTKPYPQLLYILSMTFTSPVPKEAEMYADEQGNLTDHPVGTGPFLLKKWDRGRQVVLERNPNYHPDFYPAQGGDEFRQKGMLADAGKPVPFLDKAILDIIKEDQPRWLNFMSGKLDLMGIPKDNFNQAISQGTNLTPQLESRGIKLNIETGTAFYYISFNMRDKVLGGNKLLRQAISSAIDRDKWIETFTNGRGKKMSTALPPGVADRPQSAKLKYDYNVERAKELLKKAGFPNGQGLPVINFDLRSADSVSRQMGEFFEQQLAAVGIKINVIPNTFPAFLEKAKKGNLQMSLGGWSLDYPDAENVYQLLYGPNSSPGPNEANYDNPEMNKLYTQMAVMESGAKRADIVAKMDEILQEECPWALGYYATSYAVHQPWFENYRNNGIILNTYKYYRINKEVKKQYKETGGKKM